MQIYNHPKKTQSYKLYCTVVLNLNTFLLDGFFKIDDNDYPIDLNVKSNNFLIKPFSAIGEEVLQNFEGYFDSNFNISGTFYKPNFEGYL